MREVDETKIVYVTIRGTREKYAEIDPREAMAENDFKEIFDDNLF